MNRSMMKNNVLLNGRCEDLLMNITDSSVDLTILDPPYFRILQEKWDYFKSLSDYLSWSETYLSLIEKKMRINGTILLFGCSRNFNVLSKLNNILEDLNYNFIQEIVLDKGFKTVAGGIHSNIKMYPTVSETILVYRKNYNPFIKEFLKKKQLDYKLSYKTILEYLGDEPNGSGVWGKYTGNTQFPQFPTKEHWDKFQTLFNFNIPYNSIKETFNIEYGLTNVWTDVNFREKNRVHPAQKPEFLMNRLIKTYSDENDVVLDPFSGSGTTLYVANNLNRYYIGIEENEDYFQLIKNRLGIII